MKATQPNNVKPPARINFDRAWWLHPPVMPNARFPDGLPGMLVISADNGVNVYMVMPQLADGAVQGWRLTQSNGKVYDIDLAHGMTCDCPDSQFRKRPCKHVHALQSVLGEVIDAERPVWRSLAEPSEHGLIEPEPWDYDPAA